MTTLPVPAIDGRTSERNAARRLRRVLLVVLVVAGAAIWANGIGGAFVFDDLQHIVENERLGHAAYAWGSRPLVRVSLMLNHALGGLEPAGYHVFNIIVHLAAGAVLLLLVDGVLRRMRPDAARATETTWIAFAIALLWTVHPLQTQSVTYVIQRAEAMMGLFLLLMLLCLLRSATSVRPRAWWAGAVAACALGMLSKPVMITAPIVAVLFDRAFLAGSWRDVIRRRGIVHAALAATLVLPFLTGVASTILDADTTRPVTAGFGMRGITPIEYALSQPGVILHYLRLAIWPAPLCLDYAWPVARGFTGVVVPGVAVASLLGATLWTLRRRPAIGFLGAVFFLVLAPTSTIVPFKDLANEHRMYLPLAAVVAGIVLVASALLARVRRSAAVSPVRVRTFATILLAGSATLLAATTVARNAHYHDPLELWGRVVTLRPENARAWSQLGLLQAKADDDEIAIACYRRALALDPDLYDAYNNLGNALARLGRRDEAVASYERVFAIRPDYHRAHHNLANVLASLERPAEALPHYEQAVARRPLEPRYRLALGRALMRAGRTDDAIAQLREAARLAPDGAPYHSTLGHALLRGGDAHAALPAFERAVELDPHSAQARSGLAQTLAMNGRPDDAVALLVETVEHDPADASAANNLARILSDLGDVDAHLASHDAGSALMPVRVRAHLLLGERLWREGRPREATAAFRRVLELDPANADAKRHLERLTSTVTEPEAIAPD